MALDFPSNPTNGQVYGTYTYDSVVGVWRTTPDLASGLPAGTIVQWPGATAPANWMIADGSAISRSTYASLFSAIGIQYGAGDGSTTFNLPNLKGRVVAGLDSSQTEFNTLGETGGAKTHTLTEAEMPSHTHTQNAHSHSVILWSTYSGVNPPTLYSGTTSAANSGSPNATYNGSTTATNQNTGGGGAHNNLQPYIVLNYIIKLSAGITAGDSELATRVGVVETRSNAMSLSQNFVLNGGFDIWQRGTSFTALTLYGADRWRVTINSSSPSLNVTKVSGPSASIKYAARYLQATAQASVVEYAARQFMETQHIASLAGKTATISFWYRSNKVGTHSVRVSTETRATGGTNVNTAFTVTTADVWARYSVSVSSFAGITAWTAGDTDWGGYVDIGFRTGNTFGFTSLNANDYFELSGVQLEEGSYATPFRLNAPSTQAELAACQRYYYKSAHAYGYYNIFNSGNMQSSSFTFPVTMRTTTPTITVYDNAGAVNKITIANAGGSSQNTITPPTSMQVTADSFMWVAGGMGGTPGNNGMVYMSAFTAEAEL